MLEVVVFSKRIMEKTKKGTKAGVPNATKSTEVHQISRQRQVPKSMPAPSFAALQKLLWNKVSVIRNRESLTKAADILAAWQQSLPVPTDRPSHELHNLVLTARLVTEEALLREESRGAHFRADFPQSSPQWQRHLVFTIK
jgi:L-aspartate oxidase